MAFDADDITELETAIMELASGNAVMVQIGNRMWRKSNLNQMMKIYDWMVAKVATASTNSIVRMTFNKVSNQDEH